MKRLLVIVLIILIALCPFFCYDKKDDFFSSFSGKYSFVTNKFNVNVPSYVNCQQNGADIIVSCDLSKRELAHIKSGKILSEVLELEYDKKIFQEIISFLSLQVAEDITIEDKRVLTGYSKNINSITIESGKRINTQIVVSPGAIIIGFPLIRISF